MRMRTGKPGERRLPKGFQWPIEHIRRWVEIEGRTLQWVADRCGTGHQVMSKVCRRFGIRTQRTGPRAGAGHPEWDGGRLIDKSGYVLLYCPGHPRARAPRKCYVLEHRLVMERHLGRLLTDLEVVHHRNGVRGDNRIENLELHASNGRHLAATLPGKPHNVSPANRAKLAELMRKRRSQSRSVVGARPCNQTSSRSKGRRDSTRPIP